MTAFEKGDRHRVGTRVFQEIKRYYARSQSPFQIAAYTLCNEQKNAGTGALAIPEYTVKEQMMICRFRTGLYCVAGGVSPQGYLA